MSQPPSPLSFQTLSDSALQGYENQTGIRLVDHPHAKATPLHYAAFCGMHDVIKSLIVDYSQDVNARGLLPFDKEETPLHVASRRRRVDVVQLLLEHGADVDARDDDERSPLHLASDGGHVEVVRVLLEHRADTEIRDKYDCSPLERASAEGFVGVVLVLLRHGANANAQSNEKLTPLHYASVKRHLAVARALFEHGADVNARDEDGQTPLYWAQGEEVPRFLLEHGADANTLDIKGWTPLHQASESGRVGAVLVLLEHGLDVNSRDANCRTPLHLASNPWYTHGGHPDVVRLLVLYGADIHARDDRGQTPFMILKEENHIVLELLEQQTVYCLHFDRWRRPAAKESPPFPSSQPPISTLSTLFPRFHMLLWTLDNDDRLGAALATVMQHSVLSRDLDVLCSLLARRGWYRRFLVYTILFLVCFFRLDPALVPGTAVHKRPSPLRQHPPIPLSVP